MSFDCFYRHFHHCHLHGTHHGGGVVLRKLLVGDSTLTASASPVLKMFIIRIKIRAILESNLARAQGEFSWVEESPRLSSAASMSSPSWDVKYRSIYKYCMCGFIALLRKCFKSLLTLLGRVPWQTPSRQKVCWLKLQVKETTTFISKKWIKPAGSIQNKQSTREQT